MCHVVSAASVTSTALHALIHSALHADCSRLREMCLQLSASQQSILSTCPLREQGSLLHQHMSSMWEPAERAFKNYCKQMLRAPCDDLVTQVDQKVVVRDQMLKTAQALAGKELEAMGRRIGFFQDECKRFDLDLKKAKMAAEKLAHDANELLTQSDLGAAEAESSIGTVVCDVANISASDQAVVSFVLACSRFKEARAAQAKCETEMLFLSDTSLTQSGVISPISSSLPGSVPNGKKNPTDEKAENWKYEWADFCQEATACQINLYRATRAVQVTMKQSQADLATFIKNTLSLLEESISPTLLPAYEVLLNKERAGIQSINSSMVRNMDLLVKKPQLVTDLTDYQSRLFDLQDKFNALLISRKRFPLQGAVCREKMDVCQLEQRKLRGGRHARKILGDFRRMRQVFPELDLHFQS